MRLIMTEILIMSFGGFLFNPHYLHTLMHDVIKTHYEPPKFIMSISIIMSLIMTLLVFQCGHTSCFTRPSPISDGSRAQPKQARG